MFSFSTTTQLVLNFALTQPHPMLSHRRQRPLVMLLVKLLTIHRMLVTAFQLIPSVGFAMHVAGAAAIIMQLLVLLRSLLVLGQILRSQSVTSAINCLALVAPSSFPLLNTELNLLLLFNCDYLILFVPISFLSRSFVVFLVTVYY